MGNKSTGGADVFRDQDFQFLLGALDQHAIVSLTDVQGTIIHANDKMCEISGYRCSELIGANHRILKSDAHDDAFFRDMWRTISSGGIWEGEIKNRRKDGSFYWVKTTIAPQLTADGKPERYVSIRTDITNHVHRREELSAARDQLLAARSTQTNFLAAMSHDLRTPLNSIIGFSEMMEREVFGPIENEKYSSYASIVCQSAKQLLALVNDILDLSKMETMGYTLKKERYDPIKHSRDVGQSFEYIAREKAIDYRVVATKNAPLMLTADPRVATQIQNNLLSNAFKHVGRGGMVRLIWDRAANGDVTLTVEDDGPGIDDLVLNNFGQPFLVGNAFEASASAKTHGLGLYICKRYVEARGGHLDVANREDGGAMVTASWPADAIGAEFRED